MKFRPKLREDQIAPILSEQHVKPGDTIVVWFSRGAASAVALKETIRQYGDICNIRAVSNPVVEEHSDNYRFSDDVSAWCNIEIETARNSKYPHCSAKEIWAERRFMAGVAGAPCTTQLKREARFEWELKNKF